MIIAADAESRLRMSAFRGKPDVLLKASGRLLIATSGHSGSDKTFIGRIERGFDFPGYHFGPEGLSVAKKTVENFVARAIRLYEQEPGEACASSRLGLYVRRWVSVGRRRGLNTRTELAVAIIGNTETLVLDDWS